MPRRANVAHRAILPDAKFHNVTVAKFINRVMERGKKTVADKIIYDALQIVETQAKKPAMEVFEAAVRNATPLLMVKARRVGGATYQVPIEVPAARGMSLAMRWLITSARAQKGKPMAKRLANEIMDAYQNQGPTVKKKEDTHKMAEANRAFAHYRW